MTDKQILEKAKEIYIRCFDDDFKYPDVLNAIRIGVEEGSEFKDTLKLENEKKISELLIAQANGKTIQTKMVNGEWRDVMITENDKKCDASFYRIKPDEERNCKNCSKTSCKNYGCDLPFTCDNYREEE